MCASELRRADEMRLYLPDEAGRDGYPLEWHRLIKHLVREQAGHRCVRCSHPYPPNIVVSYPRGEWTLCDERCTPEGPWMLNGKLYTTDQPISKWRILTIHQPLAHWRILTVHHLDGNKLNCRWWNLVALCQRCHLEIQGKVHLHRPWPWPHSEWFRPYVAGYYAWKHCKHELTRDEVEARMDELLAQGAREAAYERMPI